MSIKGKISNGADADLQLAFDVGHSSIGWAVLQSVGQASPRAESTINILGCGSVVFRADDCLASSRRAYRRQRRHIRSTRQRIARMKILLKHLGVLTKTELDKPGCAWPWKLAAQILQGGKLLTWPELWDVLRWYAHNRGYDGNRRWSAAETEAQSEDSEKEAKANSLLDTFKTKYGHEGSMAEVFCDIQGINPLGKKKSANLSGDKRPKGQNAAFPRKIVESEVRQILQKHFGKLKNVDANLERTLLGKDNNDKLAWQAVPCPDLKLPKRYEGGLLFGQLVPRFDNRIISICPISGQKVPSRNCPEFLNFRWAMQLANIKVGKVKDRELQPLKAEHRAALDKLMRVRGHLTPTELKKAVRELTGCERDNLDTMLMHPDAKEALLLDPVQKLISSDDVQPFWKLFPERLQKRLRGQWRHGKILSLTQIREQLESLGGDISAFDAELQKQLDAHNSKAKKKEKQISREELLQKHYPPKPLKLDGRAAFARYLLKQVYEEVLAGKPHPKEKDGCLFITQEMRDAQLNRSIADQTNNHLVRHRLLILQRLLADIIKEKDYADGKKERIGKITIEVNRDLREMSGKTAKEKAQDLGLRIANHHAVAEKLEATFAEENIKQPVTAGLIRKARIAEDLSWRCPYTGIEYEPKNIVTRFVDKDHVVPRSERASDSLDSLVITFSAVNKMKGKRTAFQFVSEDQGKTVPDLPNLSIMSLTRYKQFVESLESYKGHDDDKRRKKKRKELMLLPKYEEKEFTPRDLTQTSQLVRLGAQILKRTFTDCKKKPPVISLPGSVTGTVRKAWKVLGCLSLANPQVLDENGEVKNKTDIRDITHLHHALDACVLGLSSHFIPNNGSVWELIVKRNLNDLEKQQLVALGVFGFNAEKRFEMRDLDYSLKEQIRQRLAEKRVVQHIPSRMDGLRVEQNTWRVVAVKDDEVILKQRIRQPDGTRPEKVAEEKPSKLLGLNPLNGNGKLAKNKGALVIPDNFGVALDPQPTVIPFHKVWSRLQELKKTNGGKMPRVLRNGQLIQYAEKGKVEIWKVFSIKNTARGIMLDIGHPDETSNSRNNNRLASSFKKWIEDFPPKLYGHHRMSYHIVSIDSPQCSISCKDGQLTCKTAEGERKLPLEDVASIIVTSFSASIHSELFLEAAKHGVALIICEAFKPVSLVLPANRSTDTILSRAMLDLTPRARAHLWQKTINAKCQNQFALAEHIAPNDKWLNGLRETAFGKKPHKEAICAKMFWQIFGRSLNDEDFVRERGRGGLNHFLNYGYAVLLSTVLQKLFGVGLDPTFGISHVTRERATPLAYDLMEQFRPCVDWRVVQWVKKHPDPKEWEVTKEFRKWVTGFPLERVDYLDLTLEIQGVIEGVVRGFRKAVIQNQPRHYKPWTPKNSKWAG